MTHDASSGCAVMKTMRIARRRLAGVAFVATMGSVCAQPPAVHSAPDDRAISAGHWAVVAVEWNGKQVDSEFLTMLTVVFRVDGTWSVLFKGLPTAEGRSTIHQDQEPKTFEMETLGSEGIKPKHFSGIYKIDGDSRVLCIAPDGDPRPKEFSAPSLTSRMLVTLKRASKP